MQAGGRSYVIDSKGGMSFGERQGLGFELPSKIIVIGRNGRKLESARDLEMTATA